MVIKRREGRVHRLDTPAGPATVASWAVALGFVAALLCLAPSATAVNKYWTDGNGQWNVSGNWSPTGQPQAGDDVLLTQTDATDRTVTYYNTTNPTAILSSLKIDATGAGKMTLDLSSGHILKFTTEYVGYDGTGAITQSAGAHTATMLYLGYDATGLGTYTLNGGTLSSSSAEYVGYSGTGTLNIEVGGQVSNTYGYLGYMSGSTGTATVTGVGSTWTNSNDLRVGYLGTGTLNIEAGGQVSNTNGYLGYRSGSTGTATVTGVGSTWTNSSWLMVGWSGGTGTLNIEAGGQVSSNCGELGASPGSTGRATVTGAGSTWTSGDCLYVGDYGAGTLVIEAGGHVSNAYGCMGYSWSGSTGTATVTGVGSTWTNSGDLYVGYQGTGTLAVADGGLVTAKTLWASLSSLSGNGKIAVGGAVLDGDLVFDSTHGLTQTVAFGTGGTLDLNVDGTGRLGVGYKGTGTLRIADGRAVASVFGYLGYCSGSTGTATVTGAGSTWTSRVLYVGYSGTGTLNIEAGGQVSSTYGRLGYMPDGGGTGAATGTATVTGAGSTWTTSGDFYVGCSGTGTVNVEAGGQVSNTSGYLGVQSGSTGTATVTGAGSTWTSGDLYVGYRGTGTLNIQNGGQMSNTNGYLGWSGSSSSAVTVEGSGSCWNNTGSVCVGGSAAAAGGTGSLAVQDGAQMTVGGTLRIWNTGSLTIQSGGSVTAGTLEKSDGGTINWTSGTLGITNPGGLTIASAGPLGSSLTLRAGQTLNVTDTLTVAADATLTVQGGSLSAGTLTNLGTLELRPDDSTTVASPIANSASVRFEVAPGTWTFDEALGGGGTFVKSGDGTLIVAGPQDYDPGALFDVRGGTVVLQTDAGSDGTDLSVSVADAEVDFACDQHLDTLSIGDSGIVRFTGARVVVLEHLVMDGFDFGAMTLTPEPATLALLALGGLGVLARRRQTWRSRRGQYAPPANQGR